LKRIVILINPGTGWLVLKASVTPTPGTHWK